MTLDLESGALEGELLSGTHAGRRLSELDDAALFALLDDDTAVQIADLALTEDETEFRSFSTGTLNTIVQSILLDRSEVVRFEIRFPTSPLVFRILPLTRAVTAPGVSDTRFSLTVVGQPPS
jgi:hypothetical protein